MEKPQQKKQEPKFSFTRKEVELIFSSLVKDEEVTLAEKVNSGNSKLKLALDLKEALIPINEKTPEPQKVEEEDLGEEDMEDEYGE